MLENPNDIPTAKQRTLWSTAQVEPGSTADFLRTLRRADAEKGNGDLASASVIGLQSDIQGQHLSCSRVDWERRFGPPKNVLDHDAALARLTIQTWDQPCTDGHVLCVGHLYQGRTGDSWVVLFRTCPFSHLPLRR